MQSVFPSDTGKLKIPWHHYPVVSLGLLIPSYPLILVLSLHVEKILSSVETTTHSPYPVWNTGGRYAATVIGKRFRQISQRAAHC